MMNELLLDYISEHSAPEPKLLQELNRETHLKTLHPRMLSGHLQGRFLAMISCMIRPFYILEIGTFTGYSALCLAEGLQEGGIIDTIDINPELEWLSSSFFDKAGLGSNIVQHTGDAALLLPGLLTNRAYDLVFMDADKEHYPLYYTMLRKHLAPGTFLVADNVLWDGKVIQPIRSGDKETRGIVAFNDLVSADQGVDTVMLPLRDGLSIIRIVREQDR